MYAIHLYFTETSGGSGVHSQNIWWQAWVLPSSEEIAFVSQPLNHTMPRHPHPTSVLSCFAVLCSATPFHVSLCILLCCSTSGCAICCCSPTPFHFSLCVLLCVLHLVSWYHVTLIPRLAFLHLCCPTVSCGCLWSQLSAVSGPVVSAHLTSLCYECVPNSHMLCPCGCAFYCTSHLPLDISVQPSHFL